MHDPTRTMPSVGFCASIVAILLVALLGFGCQSGGRLTGRGTFGDNGLDGEAAVTGLVGSSGAQIGPTVALNTSLALSVLAGPEVHRAFGLWGVRAGVAAGAHLFGEGTGSELRATAGVVHVLGDGYAVGLELLGVARPIRNRDLDWFAGAGVSFELGGCWRPATEHAPQARTCR